MKAEGKSRSSADERRARAIERVKVQEFGDWRAHHARGLLSQLRAAGFVPASVAAEESGRVAVEWRDAEGRRCVLRPYAVHQWEVRRERLPDERDELRRLEQEREKQLAAEYERDRETREQRARLERHANVYPESAAAFRDELIAIADVFLGSIERATDGNHYEGCSIDEGSQDEVRAAIASIKATLSAATWLHDPRGKARARAELARFDARNDEHLQAWLRRTVGDEGAP